MQAEMSWEQKVAFAKETAKAYLECGLDVESVADMLDNDAARLPRDDYSGRGAYNGVAEVLRQKVKEHMQ
jgi:hypothetical protein